MGVVLCKAAHTEHSVEHAASLVSVTGAELGHTDRQVAVGALLRLVDGDVPGTVHGLRAVRAALHLERAKHRVLEIFEVPGNLENALAHDVRRIHQVVAVPEDQLLLELLDLTPNDRALGVPEDQTGTDASVSREEVELTAPGRGGPASWLPRDAPDAP